jgi:hypothetical protein
MHPASHPNVPHLDRAIMHRSAQYGPAQALAAWNPPLARSAATRAGLGKRARARVLTHGKSRTPAQPRSVTRNIFRLTKRGGQGGRVPRAPHPDRPAPASRRHPAPRTPAVPVTRLRRTARRPRGDTQLRDVPAGTPTGPARRHHAGPPPGTRDIRAGPRQYQTPTRHVGQRAWAGWEQGADL